MCHSRLRAGVIAGLSAALVALASTPARAAASKSAGCAVAADSTLLALFSSGQSFPDFLAAAKARREGWLKMADSARVDDALVARAKAVGGTWHLLVVAIDACGDSMNNVPYLAKLSELVPGLDLRVVLPVNGRPVQDTHRSLDGRTATPTVVLLDEPTRGIDVGAKLEVYELINRLTAEGKAVVLVSSELPELMGMSDRIIMLTAGRIGGAFDRADFSQEKLLAAAMGRGAAQRGE